MLKRYEFTATLAAMSAAVAVGAQTTSGAGQQQKPTPSTAQTEPRPTAAGTTTLVGCVYREADVPGREPNVVEQAGILEDYILADAKASGPQTPASGSQPQATGTSGSAGAMYKLEQIDDERLKAMVGKRVEVTGRIDREAGDRPAGATGTAGAQADRSAGPDQVELPEFEVTSIKETSGDCPATPAARK